MRFENRTTIKAAKMVEARIGWCQSCPEVRVQSARACRAQPARHAQGDARPAAQSCQLSARDRASVLLETAADSESFRAADRS